MDSFRTIVEPAKSENKISHGSPIMMLGSCFAERIGFNLKQFKFDIDLNPFGISFNPLSIHNCLERIISDQFLTENELFFHNEAWHSFMHHSQFSSQKKDVCLNQINERLRYSSKYIKSAKFLILTFGTAWVFYQNDSDKPVNNCHKLPNSQFKRRLLNVTDIVESYVKLFSVIKELNPNIKILLTISPVRHLADGAEDNQVSKSILRLAANELCREGFADYFPSFEIMLDDLRDYRFYSEDMVHPSSLAIDYIFKKFSETYFSKETIKLNSDISNITNAFGHKLINPKSEKSKIFAQKMLDSIALLEQRAYLDFNTEKAYFLKILE